MTAFNVYNGNGSQTQFPITFDYFNVSEIEVLLWNPAVSKWQQKTNTTDYNIATSNINFVSAPVAPPSGITGNVLILRKTEVGTTTLTSAQAAYTPGTAINAADLNKNQIQALRAVLDLRDSNMPIHGRTWADSSQETRLYSDLNMTGREIKNVSKIKFESFAFTEGGIEVETDTKDIPTQAELALKDDITSVDTKLALNVTNEDAKLATKADLVSGKVPASQIPNIAITEYKGTAANQAAMLTVTGEKGDWITRTDDGKVYVITGADPTSINSWTALSYPITEIDPNTVIDANYVATDENFTTADHTKLDGIQAGAEVNTVTSVNGSTGAVTVQGFSGNYSDLTNKPNLALKADLVGSVLNTNQVPELAITKFCGVVANENDMLALGIPTLPGGPGGGGELGPPPGPGFIPEYGDWCIRSDNDKVYIVTGPDSTLASDWTAISYPAAPVTSVAGRTGVVTLSTSDVSGLGTAATTASTDYATAAQGTKADSATQPADLAAVQADVDQNEADADTAIAAVQADVDQNEADADAAIAAVQADVDQNEADADAAIAAVQADVDQNEANLATVATSGSYNDLSGKPTIPTIDPDTVIDANYVATDNNFTNADHTKLNGISTGATAYANTNVDAHLNASTASNGEVLSWNGSDYDWIATAAGGASDINGLSDAVTNDSGQTIGLGTGALANDDGSSNEATAVGYNALNANTTGSYNTAVGYYALSANTTAEENTAVGYEALRNNTTGDGNTASGYRAGKFITTGFDNTLCGAQAGDALTTGNRNVVLGYDAGSGQTTSSDNTLIGYMAGRSVDSNNHIAIGPSALSNTTWPTRCVGIGNSALSQGGTDNVAVGYQAGRLGSSSHTRGTLVGNYAGWRNEGEENTFVGYNAGVNVTTADNCTLLGSQAGDSITTGSHNVAIGYLALDTITTGSRNTAVGRYALAAGSASTQYSTVVGDRAGRAASNYETFIGADCFSEVSGHTYGVGLGYGAGQWNRGDKNTAIGYRTCGATNYSDGDENTAVGYQGLHNVTTGGYNTVIGSKSGQNITTGQYNLIAGGNNIGSSITTGSYNVLLCGYVGDTSGSYNTYVGGKAGYSTSGSNNIIIGAGSGWTGYSVSGSSNVIIGDYAGYAVSGNNCIIIGQNAAGTGGSNEITLGHTSIATLRCNTQTISSLSDGRDKTEVEDLPLGLDFIDTLRPVKFKWDTRDGNSKDGSFDAGFIAQDLQSVQEDSNAEYLDMVMDSNPDRLEARYGQLIPVLVQAIKDLSTQVKQLQTS